jgi:hypothetical protein
MRELLAPDDTRDALRKIGGLLFGIGMLMLFLRKGEDWGDFVVFLILAVPAAFFYLEGVLSDRWTGSIRPWQAVYSVLGLIFVPLALLQLVTGVFDGSDSGWNTFWIFGVTAGLAFYAGAVKGIRFHLLAGSIALIISWSGLWDELLSDGIGANFGIWRGVLGILAIMLLAGALYLWRQESASRVEGTAVGEDGDRGLWKASELVTGAGIAAVLACSLGISSIATFLDPLGVVEFRVVETGAHWDVLLLLVSLGLVAIGSSIGTRGPVYVGAIGLFLFLLIAGFDLDDDSPEPDKLGIWPIVLIAAGLIGIALGGLRQSSLGDRPRGYLRGLKSGQRPKSGS